MADKLNDMLKGKKISDIFQDYAEPFIKFLLLDRIEHGIHDTPSIEELKTAYRFPWGVWNAIIAEQESKNKINHLPLLSVLFNSAPAELRLQLKMLEERKRNKFSQYQYYLGDYSLFYNQDNELRLRVEARC